MNRKEIDHGKSFDWGKTSEDYGKYRDVYPKAFYERIAERGVGLKGQKVLDIGTGTGVLPRNMYRFGADWIGIDMEENQILQARELAEQNRMDMEFYVCPAEEADFPDHTFDAITMCQCVWYPEHKIFAPEAARMLKDHGKLLILYMGWLPYEDKIAGKSEELILKHNPNWTGFGDTRKHVWIPDEYSEYFDITLQEEFDAEIPFTRETWHGRMKACRGTSASMPDTVLKKWEEEHKMMLEKEADESFEILHYISLAELTLRE